MGATILFIVHMLLEWEMNLLVDYVEICCFQNVTVNFIEIKQQHSQILYMYLYYCQQMTNKAHKENHTVAIYQLEQKI